jgi:integrase
MDERTNTRTDAAVGGSPEACGAATRPAAEQLHEEVTSAWSASGDFTQQTLDRCSETLLRFLRRQAALGVTSPQEFTPAHCADFVNAHGANGHPPENSTMHARRTALRMLFRTLRDLGIPAGDPTLDLALPPRTATAARPLTDIEVALCRTSARLGEAGSLSLQRAVCWALGEATAISSEISAVRIRDIDDPERPTWVRLSGTRRCDPRLGELTDWGSAIIARQIAAHRERGATKATLVAYRGNAPPGQDKAQAATCNALSAVLKYAGLADEPDVRPASLRNWAGRRLLDAGMPIDQVARRLGSRSLDTAAEDVGHVWRTAP